MQQKIETTEQRERQKKFLLVLPLIFLPLLALVFWKFGGGKAEAGEQTVQQRGINTELPQAQFKGEKSPDKMGLYDLAAKDSALAKQREAGSLFGPVKPDSTLSGNKSLMASNQRTAANEARINQKLAQIRQQINSTPGPKQYTSPAYAPPASADMSSAQVDRLEKMMKAMQGQQNDDPQMKQLAGMMDKIYQLQHPELVEARLKKEAKPQPDSTYKAIRAVIASSQKVVSGASVRLKLLDTINIHGQIIPKGAFLFGLCQVNNQRLILNIKNIRLGTSIVPCDLSVYDMDGMIGINAPDAITEGAVRGGSDNALQSMQFLPMDETLGTQAASAGIETAKGLFSKKVKVVKVKLKAGYPVLLRINKN